MNALYDDAIDNRIASDETVGASVLHSGGAEHSAGSRLAAQGKPWPAAQHSCVSIYAR
jgi:hypothetical protein